MTHDSRIVQVPPKRTAWQLPVTTSHPELLDDAGRDADFRQLIYGIFTLSVNFHRIRDRMATALGLSGIQYHIVMVVSELEPMRPVTVTAVAERLYTSSAYITMETKKLTALGLLDKQPNPDDGRSVLLTLTDRGRSIIEAFAPHLREINDTLFSDVGPETFRHFRDIVDHMRRTSDHAAVLADRRAHEYIETPAAEAVEAIRR